MVQQDVWLVAVTLTLTAAGFFHAKQADDHQEARLQGLSELYNVLPDPQLQYNVLLELMR